MWKWFLLHRFRIGLTRRRSVYSFARGQRASVNCYLLYWVHTDDTLHQCTGQVDKCLVCVVGVSRFATMSGSCCGMAARFEIRGRSCDASAFFALSASADDSFCFLFLFLAHRCGILFPALPFSSLSHSHIFRHFSARLPVSPKPHHLQRRGNPAISAAPAAHILTLMYENTHAETHTRIHTTNALWFHFRLVQSRRKTGKCRATVALLLSELTLAGFRTGEFTNAQISSTLSHDGYMYG